MGLLRPGYNNHENVLSCPLFLSSTFIVFNAGMAFCVLRIFSQFLRFYVALKPEAVVNNTDHQPVTVRFVLKKCFLPLVCLWKNSCFHCI